MERVAPARARVSNEAAARQRRPRAGERSGLGPVGPARLLAGVVRGAARLCRARLASIALLTEMADRTCREVAAALELSDHTVQRHVERLKLRFGKATLHGLLGLLVERHLID